MLEAGGVVRRRRLPPPAGSQVYELTERGADREPVFNALAAWGTRSPAPPPPTSWSWWPNTVIDEAARAAGRDRAAIRRICNIGGERTRSPLAGAGDDDQQIVGPPDHWVDVPTRLAVEVGFSAFVLWGEPEETRLRTLAGEIDPAVRARVAEIRARRADSAPMPPR